MNGTYRHGVERIPVPEPIKMMQNKSPINLHYTQTARANET